MSLFLSHTYTLTPTRTHPHTHIHSHTYTQKHTRTRTHTHIQTHTYIQMIYSCYSHLQDCHSFTRRCFWLLNGNSTYCIVSPTCGWTHTAATAHITPSLHARPPTPLPPPPPHSLPSTRAHVACSLSHTHKLTEQAQTHTNACTPTAALGHIAPRTHTRVRTQTGSIPRCQEEARQVNRTHFTDTGVSICVCCLCVVCACAPCERVRVYMCVCVGGALLCARVCVSVVLHTRFCDLLHAVLCCVCMQAVAIAICIFTGALCANPQ